MFHQKDKREKSTATKQVKLIKDLTAIVSPAEMLSGQKRQTLLQQINALSMLKPPRFEELGLKLIYQLTNYCQNLPETANSYYSLPGGILEYALNRAEAALQLFHQYLVHDEHAELSDIQKLWLYALFTASLLKDLGKLQIDYRVNVFDPFGQPHKLWNPLIESLIAAGNYYQFEFLPDSEDKIVLRQRINLLIARLIMPHEGFAWIASNPEVLAVWLALLSDDWQSAGTLGAILIRADAIAIQRYLNEHMVHHAVKRSPGAARIGTFIDTKPDVSQAKEQMLGVEFIKWMTAALESGQIMINKPPLWMVPGGLLMHPDIFKYFVRANPEYKNWQSVQSGFLSLHLHRPGLNGAAMSRFEQTNNHQMLEGIVFNKYAIALPKIVHVNHLNTGKVSKISAVDFIAAGVAKGTFVQQNQFVAPEAVKQLTASGQWKIIQGPIAAKSGFLKGA